MARAVWSAFDDLVESAPGLVVGVTRAGELTDWASFGAQWPGGPALDVSSSVYVASIAKQFTAACIGLLVLDGTLALTDDVHRWIPELPAYRWPLRVEHLLAHTSGLPDANTVDDAAGFDLEDDSTTGDRVAVIATVELEHEPGSVHRYNNLGYVLLAETVARATGRRLGEYANEQILAPLSMRSSWFLDSPHPDAVPGWTGEGRRVDITTRCVGDGGLVTSVSDLARWDRWLPRSDLAPLMLTDRPSLPDGSWAHDAWGVSLRRHHGQRIESHGGSAQGHVASLIRFPDADASIIAVANTDGIDGYGVRLRALADDLVGDVLDHNLPPWTETHGVPLGRQPAA